METQKSYKFSEINYKKLKEIADFKLVRDRTIFNEWFDFKYEISKYDEDYLTKLIKLNEYNIADYDEYQLLAHFISPLLYKVYFLGENFREWYQPHISGTVNEKRLYGRPDFMIASGNLEPEIPFFFLQEFKKQKTSSDPLRQLLAQMTVAVENNKTKQMKGCYNIGRWWSFVILEKNAEGKYKYYESRSFDSLDIDHIKKIYIYLKAVKHKYCK
jgi:hypothetical protein